ncbi:MAG: sugar phosphate isomerase/epimerase [Pirellulaceae bacterium]|jgi:sugar phosphate isomerase/epimerase|nr:sugar phosphate isomerase/epimerase [Pirellulaceae bacterium]
MGGGGWAAIERRAFLAQAAGGIASLGGVWALSSTVSGAQASGWKMRLSGSSINFMRLPVEGAIREISLLGYDAIDIWSAHAGCPHLDDVLNRLGAPGLLRLLDEHGLKLCGFSVYAGGYPRYAELLGAAGGGVAIRGSAPPCDPGELRTCMTRFLEELKPEAELAEKHNSFLAIENHGHALLNSLDSFKLFTELNDNPQVGIALAPYHLQVLGVSVEDAIRIAGKQLFYFYAWQHAPGVKQLPGHGETDFTPWLAALAEVNYAGYVNPFLHDEPEPAETAAALARSIAYLRETERRAVAVR